MGSDYPTVRKRMSDKGLGDSAESMITRVEFLASGSDDSTLSRWTFRLMDRSNDQKPLGSEFNYDCWFGRSDYGLKTVGQTSRTNDVSNWFES